MAIFNWKLFGCTIQEETAEESSPDREIGSVCPPVPEENSENPDDGEQQYTISDAVLEAYYVTVLREIHTQEHYVRGWDEAERRKQLQRLNEIDNLLGLWVKRGKALVSSWEQRYREIPREGNEALENAVRRYAGEAYRRLGKRGRETENLNELSEAIIEHFTARDSNLQGTAGQELRRFLTRLTGLIEEGTEEPRQRRRIYAQLRILPMYLGAPYAQRYALYSELREYNALTGAGRASTVIYMVLSTTLFEEYCETHIQKMAGYVSDLQNEICQGDVMDFEAQWDITYDRLEQELCHLPITNHTYVKGNRCFALIDVILQRGIARYVCFSGLFDSPDPTIRTKFGCDNKFFAYLKEALLKITEAVLPAYGPENVMITANGNIRYYYRLCRSVKLEDACLQVQEDFHDIKRMFSCCERKFLTELETISPSHVRVYEMYIKLKPCELCQKAIDSFEQGGYQAKIVCGKAVNPKVAHKSLYDGLAQDIAASKTGIVFHIS